MIKTAKMTDQRLTIRLSEDDDKALQIRKRGVACGSEGLVTGKKQVSRPEQRRVSASPVFMLIATGAIG
jgi:hypothetical protein